MADLNDRTTSFSKKVKGLHHEENALDRAKPLKGGFTPPEPDDPSQPPKETGKVGSKMIREDAPSLRPVPRGIIRTIPDRYAAETRLGKEHDAEEERLKAALKAKARQRFGQEKEKDDGRER